MEPVVAAAIILAAGLVAAAFILRGGAKPAPAAGPKSPARTDAPATPARSAPRGSPGRVVLSPDEEELIVELNRMVRDY